MEPQSHVSLRFHRVRMFATASWSLHDSQGGTVKDLEDPGCIWQKHSFRRSGKHLTEDLRSSSNHRSHDHMIEQGCTPGKINMEPGNGPEDDFPQQPDVVLQVPCGPLPEWVSRFTGFSVHLMPRAGSFRARQVTSGSSPTTRSGEMEGIGQVRRAKRRRKRTACWAKLTNIKKIS